MKNLLFLIAAFTGFGQIASASQPIVDQALPGDASFTKGLLSKDGYILKYLLGSKKLTYNPKTGEFQLEPSLRQKLQDEGLVIEEFEAIDRPICEL